MKDFKFAKTIQMVLMIVLTAIIIVFIFKDNELFHLLANNGTLRIIAAFFWLLMVVCFVFLVYDFSVYAGLKRKYGEIDMALYSDPLTGIGNRSSLDAFIDEYSGKPLPYGTGAITFTLTNMRDINLKYGNLEGDKIIKDFSDILAEVGRGVCFVGRNGGNNFLALFKDSSQEAMQNVIDAVYKKIEQRNEDYAGAAISFKYGETIYTEAEEKMTMSELVASSFRKAMSKE